MSGWDDIDKDVVCGNCYALININRYRTCRKYCDSQDLECRKAYEESGDSCKKKKKYDCDTEFDWTSDALCMCKDDSDREGIIISIMKLEM